MNPYDDRLDNLLATAARVFAEKGYFRTSMRDLARATGMSLSGLYYYMRSKEELLFLIQDRTFSQVRQGAEEATAAVTDPMDRLRAFTRHHVGFFARHMAEMKVLSHEAESLTGEHAARIRAQKRDYVAFVQDLIARAAPPEADHATAAYALFGMMNWIYTWYDPAGPLSPEALGEQFFLLFTGGLLAPAQLSATPGG